MMKKSKFRKNITILFALIGLLIVVNFFLFRGLADSSALPFVQEQGEPISGKNYVLKKREGQVVKSKKQDEKIAVASMTKIMTALYIIEHVENLDQLVEVPMAIFQEIEEQGLATAGLLQGEVISYRELLYGIMLPSGADAALTAVQALSGSEEAFVQGMNETATALGMTNTHFSNATGMDEQAHYSSVGDIMLLLEYALRNEFFYQLFTTLSYQTQGTNLHVEGLSFTSTIISRDESLDLRNGHILGGKTGYTVAAGLCLASLADINGEEYLLVLAGSKGDSLTEQFNIIESRLLYNQI